MGFPRTASAGDTAFHVELGDGIDRATNARVMALHERVTAARAAGALPGVVETVPSFRSLLVVYDPCATARAALEPAVLALVPEGEVPAAAGRLWRLPACYDTAFAPDLEDLARACGIAPEEVAPRHAAAEYHVYMLGFMPGLAYMGGLDPVLQRPRRSEPRVRVPAGSIGVAGALTLVYPWESPGGWHLIGRCPVALFDRRRAEPVLLAAGDRVRFEPVDRANFEELAAAARDGTLDSETLLGAA